jgi:hypothetical protein
LLGQYKVTQPRPFLIALLECRRLNKSIPQTLFVSTVRAIENFHFVFSNVCQERASGLEGKYTRAAKQLYAAGADKTKAENVIKKLLTDLRAKRPDASKIKASLTGIELTDDDASKKQIQTIFHKIEAHRLGTSELEVAGFSLEHIDDHSNGAAWCNQIGNLLPLDEKLNNAIKKGSDFIKKKSAYSKSQLRTVADFLAQNPQGTWGKADADRWCTHVATQLDAATRV